MHRAATSVTLLYAECVFWSSNLALHSTRKVRISHTLRANHLAQYSPVWRLFLHCARLNGAAAIAVVANSVHSNEGSSLVRELNLELTRKSRCQSSFVELHQLVVLVVVTLCVAPSSLRVDDSHSLIALLQQQQPPVLG